MNTRKVTSSTKTSSIPYWKPPEWYLILARALDKELVKDAHEKAWTSAPLPKIHIPLLSETIEDTIDPIGVIGGYFYQSDKGDNRLKERASSPYKDLRHAPIAQINLGLLSKMTDTEFGEGILQVWGTDYAWGDYGDGPVSADFDIVQTNEIKKRPERTCIPLNLDWFSKKPEKTFTRGDLEALGNLQGDEQKAINFKPLESLQHACFDWSNSHYFTNLGLSTPIFITGLIDAGLNFRTEKKAQQKALTKKRELELRPNERSKLKETFSKEDWDFRALSLVQSTEMGTSFGNFDAENVPRSSKTHWRPLMTLNGPLDLDFYTIFYSSKEGESIKYKVSANRNYF